MANDEQVEILLQGASRWNTWRKQHPNECIDLSHKKFKKIDLTNVDLHKAFLDHTNFSKATLIDAIFSDAIITNTNFNGADLIHANFTNAIACDAKFRRANLFDADITGADMSGADFSKANVTLITYSRISMMDKYSGTIGIGSCFGNPIYQRDAEDQIYIDAFREQATRKWWKLTLCYIWGFFDYGRSMWRVAAFALSIIAIFGFIYACHLKTLNMPANTTPTWFTPFYFSFVTFTTLGFGDVNPIGHLKGEIAVSIEVVLGYMTLGLLLAILANTVARRS